MRCVGSRPMVVLMTGSPPGASATVLHTWEWSPQHNRKQAEDQRKMFREQAEQRKERQRAKSVSPQAGASHTGSPNGSPEIGRAICLDKLVIRKGHELESDRVGNLLEGTPVLVLEEQTLRDGTVRSRVGKESSPRGVVVDTIGWITSVKEGKGKLRPLTDADQTAIGSARRSPKRREAQVRADSPAPTWLTTSELSERAQAQWTAASSLEARVFDTVEERLGYLLVAMDRSEEEMLLEFDANNDGEVCGRTPPVLPGRPMLHAASHGEPMPHASPWQVCPCVCTQSRAIPPHQLPGKRTPLRRRGDDCARSGTTDARRSSNAVDDARCALDSLA